MKENNLESDTLLLSSNIANIYNVGQVAKLFYHKMGRNNLYKQLRNNGLLSSRNEPYQRYITKGNFIFTLKARPGQPYFIDIVSLVTEKGLQYISQLISGESNICQIINIQ